MTQPQNPQLRVVIDNSVLVAILRHRNPGNNWLIQLWTTGIIVPLASQETIHELEEKLIEHSPMSDFYLATKFVAAAMRRYEPWCERIEPQSNELNPKCQDPEDQKFIDLAFAGNVSVLITRDAKLLEMDTQTPFDITEDHHLRNRMITKGNDILNSRQSPSALKPYNSIAKL